MNQAEIPLHSDAFQIHAYAVLQYMQQIETAHLQKCVYTTVLVSLVFIPGSNTLYCRQASLMWSRVVPAGGWGMQLRTALHWSSHYKKWI